MAELETPLFGAFNSLKGALKAYQQEIQASIILKIAIAVAILVAAMVVLSQIDPAGLKQALVGMTALFAQLGATLVIVQKYGLGNDGFKTVAASVMLLTIAAAVLILATAVRQLSGYSREKRTNSNRGP